ncbi:putative aminophospholipid-translocating P4-type ATPase [Dissoconium aciculare CBS 342.82]|uniref:Phospholipid-transporting ATPase n=1 Tax=Dissoconium aciculare CBS 342.82 TaxID=1314786 RepID=A0A6J3MHM8_9PEZI|nr:putative aminophospholipid-translocating P4-type ATPase [Dissoconium aciculare CBS 342.82]KAF1827461.1 putative aminophospholipid-translocating P4-type ATPase [Dissoconium aciculare CBS 342.82]
MSVPNGFRRSPGNPDGYDKTYEDDHDSDLDLDELDPQTTLTTATNIRNPVDFGRRIPLQNLRFAGRRTNRYDDETDAEQLQGLVENETAYGSGASRTRNMGVRHRRTSEADLRRGPMQKLKSYLPFTKKERAISLPSALANNDDDLEEEHDPTATRTISVGQKQPTRFPLNAVSNAKYTPWSFIPVTLFNEFKFFFNMYFLLVALSQIIPALRVGYLLTYIAPLAFVLCITLGKEAYDDVYRRKRDNEANSEPYTVLHFDRSEAALRSARESAATLRDSGLSEKKKGKRRAVTEDNNGNLQSREGPAQSSCSSRVTEILKSSRDLKVGDVLVLGKDQRVPADVVLLKSFATEASIPTRHAAPDGASSEADLGASSGGPLTSSESEQGGGGEAFIRTDQLDGETDWKLRLASPVAQNLPVSEYVRLQIVAGKPDKKVNDFVGTIELAASNDAPYDSAAGTISPSSGPSSPLNIDHTAWANTVLASSTTVHAVVVYTGSQTRAALSTSPSRSKTGLLEYEINSLTKILCFLTAALSIVLVALEGYQDHGDQAWYLAAMRFLVLFSSIVPISLRVNLDMGKSVYAWQIHRDPGIPGTIVRTSTIPEDLGRIEYLLSDKTGTLTRNEMELKKIHVGTVSYGGEAMEEVSSYVEQAFAAGVEIGASDLFSPSTATNFLGGSTRTRREIGLRVRDLVLALALCHNVTPTMEEGEDGTPVISYQASSPDEIAIVQWTEQVGLRLAHRDRKSISLQFTGDQRLAVKVEILNVFPFTSDSKRMGIIVRFVRDASVDKDEDGEIVFFQKGADTVMTTIVAANDWLDEETGNMAREGLRTLVVGRKNLSKQQYVAFSTAHAAAAMSLSGRDANMAAAVKQHLENDLELLGVTGVEDKLQPHVKPSLELLRNAGIKIWMLTGDKVETARCVAISSKLVSRGQYIHTIAGLKRREAALEALSMLDTQPNAALLIDGQSLALYLQYHRDAFISLAVTLPAVIACRCSPTQKADVAHLIRAYTKKRVACIGDGGNDVSMIQAADVGVGIVGKEGRQASLAADFSITQFAHLTKLLVWHGRNSYKRSAKLAQFVIHRGLIIAICQTVFSIASDFEPIALYRDWLLVGYATVYTMMPVFSLVLDRDVDEGLANLYPELYKELTTGRNLSYRTFFIWVGISIYQGLIIQGGSELLVPGFTTRAAADGTSTLETEGFKSMVAVSYTVLIINEIVMVAAEITTWHPVMIFSILGTAAIYFGSLPFLGSYYSLKFVVSLGFWWRVAGIAAASLVPVYAAKLIRRTVRPPSYRKVRGV